MSDLQGKSSVRLNYQFKAPDKTRFVVRNCTRESSLSFSRSATLTLRTGDPNSWAMAA